MIIPTYLQKICGIIGKMEGQLDSHVEIVLLEYQKLSFFFFFFCTDEMVKQNPKNIKTIQSLLSLPVNHYSSNLTLVSAISNQIFIFNQMIGLHKLWKILFVSSKEFFSFLRYSSFCNFSLLFHTFQIQTGKWKWNNLWCHKLACITLQM